MMRLYCQYFIQPTKSVARLFNANMLLDRFIDLCSDPKSEGL
jgi:hypothetical protein